MAAVMRRSPRDPGEGSTDSDLEFWGAGNSRGRWGVPRRAHTLN